MTTNFFEIGVFFHQIFIVFCSDFCSLFVGLEFYKAKAGPYNADFTRDAYAVRYYAVSTSLYICPSVCSSQ